VKKKAPAKNSSPNPPRTKVMFVCLGNACRSPMAESIARYDAADVMEVFSAGLTPLGFLPNLTTETLEKNGYSTQNLKSKGISPEAWDQADIVINMSGAHREQAFPQFEKVEDWMVDDPYGEGSHVYQRIFESIQRRVAQLAESLRQNRQAGKAEE
jgi:arsenate reductase (thioredoxin)